MSGVAIGLVVSTWVLSVLALLSYAIDMPMLRGFTEPKMALGTAWCLFSVATERMLRRDFWRNGG